MIRCIIKNTHSLFDSGPHYTWDKHVKCNSLLNFHLLDIKISQKSNSV